MIERRTPSNPLNTGRARTRQLPHSPHRGQGGGMTVVTYIVECVDENGEYNGLGIS